MEDFAIPGMIVRRDMAPGFEGHTATCLVGEEGCHAPYDLGPIKKDLATVVMRQVTAQLYAHGWAQNGRGIWTCPSCLWAGWDKPIGKEQA